MKTSTYQRHFLQSLKNGELTPSLVKSRSGFRVWWQCEKGHEWEDTINHRTGGGRNCPFCNNKRVCEDNCLQTVKPEIAAEWHPSKNGSLTPNEVLPGSGKKVWWQCKHGFDWKASIYCRKRVGHQNCSECRKERKKNNYLLKMASQ